MMATMLKAAELARIAGGACDLARLAHAAGDVDRAERLKRIAEEVSAALMDLAAACARVTRKEVV